MPYETCWACNKYVSSLVFVCGTLFCYVNFETVCELCRHSWLPNICVYGLYLCCKGNEFYILCWAVYVSMCVHLAISSNFRILGTHSCVHLAIASDYICLVMIDFAKHMENFSRNFLCLETKHGHRWAELGDWRCAGTTVCGGASEEMADRWNPATGSTPRPG